MNSKYVGVAVGVSLGLCIGAAAAAMHQVGVGIAMGVAIGAAFAMVFSAAPDAALARKKTVADKPLPHPLGLFERDDHPAN